MADKITSEDIRIVREIAKRYEQRNIIGQMRQIMSDEDAKLATATLRKVADRVEELGHQYPAGIPTPENSPEFHGHQYRSTPMEILPPENARLFAGGTVFTWLVLLGFLTVIYLASSH